MVNIIIVLLLTAAIMLFPIFLTVNFYMDVSTKKAWFSLYVLHMIKIYGGYATIYKEGIAFHLTKNKAVLLPYKEAINTRKKFEITRGFFVAAYSHVIELGAEELNSVTIQLTSLLNIASNILGIILIAKKNCHSYKGDVILQNNQACVKFSSRLVFAFNLLILVVAITKIILEKILEKKAAHDKKIKQKNQ